ncbi:aminoglycoside phosphotransferase family protein [Mangrovihabitans endophyticus]|uniref:Aminoglycoside phosphotransferase n=1 Tax=Mangrovihabitans endophyticus TaxID=1751298 RepID=A0A8J3BYV4_9ACTN|nr:aminoglycoside phosphotransferase family protein [Mangrovihabitans endophyticus]GGK84812.1 aminoglycoside phosphotransferase [Mangrovihabitans endophyticus]
MTLETDGATAGNATVTAELVRDLLRDQHPDLADRPVTLGARGWANQMWRLGDDLAVRLPWAADDGAADASLRHENAWLPVLAPRLPLRVPVPQRLGEPSPRFPRPWIVTTWVPGVPADLAPATRGSSSADALAAFLTALNRPAPNGAPRGQGRGGALTEVADGVENGLATATQRGWIPDPGGIRTIWQDALAAPGWAGPPLWLHGDLHPANVLTEDGGLCGIVDFGDLCAGDPACDMAACWTLLDDQGIRRFRTAYRPAEDAATWRRARGWAVWRAMGSLFIADAGRRGSPGGKPTWGPPALASLRRLVASAA